MGPIRQVRDPGTTADYAAWYATVLPRCLTIPEEAWAAGIHPPVEIWHGAEHRARVVAQGPDPEDPFDGIPHDGQGASQAQGPRLQGPVQVAVQPSRGRVLEQGQSSRAPQGPVPEAHTASQPVAQIATVQVQLQQAIAERDAARAERDEARGWCVTAIAESDEARAHIVTLLSERDQARAQAGPGDDRVAWQSQIRETTAQGAQILSLLHQSQSQVRMVVAQRDHVYARSQALLAQRDQARAELQTMTTERDREAASSRQAEADLGRVIGE
ncbi:hypothetical protein KI387_035968 [Taxus chinensis]|uniref:Uncharacterized protein n=1 Tax=Taxus chinensis TaxID=29808 RepID=A0AA38FP65_TAXCH|nr:hypothetical protein KI387_035968 [Taxus chinensis]